MTLPTPPTKPLLAWLVWLLSALFFAYECALRVMPSVMVPELERAFFIDASAVGLLSAVYLYLYVPMQLPVGLLLDSWGTRRVFPIVVGVCAVGSILFGAAPTLWLAYVGRILMGLGSSFGFVGCIYVSTRWLGDGRLPWLAGLGNSLGSVGAVLGQGPAATLVVYVGWRAYSIAAGILGLLLATFFVGALRHQGSPQDRRSLSATTQHNLRLILRMPIIWLNAFIAFFFLAPTTAFAGLWAVPCLQSLYGLRKTEAGIISTMIWVGWIIGGPLLGWLAAKDHRLKHVLVWSSLCSCILFCLFLYVPSWPIWVVILLLLLLGIGLSGELTTYSVAVRLSTPDAYGTAPGFTNFFALLSGAVLQPVVGALLDLRLEGHAEKGLLPADYRIALTIFPVSLLIAWLLGLLLQDPAQVAARRRH